MAQRRFSIPKDKKQATAAPRKKNIIQQKPVNLLPVQGNLKWHEACNEIYQLVKIETDFEPQGEPVNFQPILDRKVAYDLMVFRYIQYVKSFNLLCECYKWVIHPQKRALLTRCIEAVAGRICEIKHEMIDINKTLYNHFDDVLFDLRVTPTDLKLQPPLFMVLNRYKIVQMRERLLALMVERLKSMDNPEVEDIICHIPFSKLDSTNDERLEPPPPTYFSIIANPPKQTCKSCDAPNIDEAASVTVKKILNNFNEDESLRKKIRRIQRSWRCYLSRKVMINKRENEEIVLEMRWPRTLTDYNINDEKHYSKRELMFRERKKEFEISKVMEHERFMAANGHNLAWELKYNITQWLLELRDLLGSFPDYPNEDEGGCERLFAMKTTEEVEAEIEEILNPPPPAKEVKKTEKAQKVEVVEEGCKPATTVARTKLIDALEEYNSYWYLKDEMDNIEQKFDRQIMLEEVREEAGKQIRLQVDELMRYELDKLRCGIEFYEMPDRSKAKDTKKAKSEIVSKDPLTHKSVEELYGELVMHGIVSPVENIKFDNIVGDHNFQEMAQNECVPTMADIKTVLMHLVVFPLSSEFLHSMLPLTNRMLFAGSRGVGKTMMVHALCREIGANLFNISPHVLSGKFVGAQQQEYLMNALLKVGKSMEPTVFIIDHCHTLFMKVAPAGTNDRPQRWINVFSKMMDKIKKGDRMFLLGMTNDPFSCNSQGMLDMFRNVIYFPRPEYGSRVMLWKEFLAKQAVCRYSQNFNHSLLAQLSEGFSPQQIESAVLNTQTPKRQKKFKPLTNRELLIDLTTDSEPPLTKEDVMAWLMWYSNSPLMKKRRLMLAEEELLAAG